MMLTNNNDTFFCPMTPQEVRGEIMSIRPNTSLENDGISSKLLKCVADYIYPLPYQRSLILHQNQAFYPKALKSSIIKPIHEKESKGKCENYRPISITSSIAGIGNSWLHSFLSGHTVSIPYIDELACLKRANLASSVH